MIHFVIGTRAQLFKMTPIMLECQKRGLEWRWIYAAQHKDTFTETLEFFGLPKPDYTVVKWNTEAKTIFKFMRWMTSMTMALLHSRKILDYKTGSRHIVLTHGDTNTTVFGALIGKLTRTKVMHVESGLRSYNIFNPFPEEINRLITFRLADYYACPGDWALKNVEKFKGIKINTIRNTQQDVLEYGIKNLKKSKLDIPENNYVVMSTHRFENIYNKDRFAKIIKIAEYVSTKYIVVIPQHPVTYGQITRQGYRHRLEENSNIILMPRLEYQDYLKLIIHSKFVMTDGGGNQEELYHLGKPTLILRDETERKEGLNSTAKISKLDMKICKDFVKNYIQYKKKRNFSKTSPTKIIVNSIESFGLPS